MGLALHPLFAVAALIFLSTGWVRHAIIALALMLIADALSILPLAVLRGAHFEGPSALFAAVYSLSPALLAVAAVMLIWRRPQRPALPAVLLSVSTLASIAAVAAFAIGVMIYGS